MRQRRREEKENGRGAHNSEMKAVMGKSRSPWRRLGTMVGKSRRR